MPAPGKHISSMPHTGAPASRTAFPHPGAPASRTAVFHRAAAPCRRPALRFTQMLRCALTLLLAMSCTSAVHAEKARDLKPPSAEQIEKSIQRGVGYLLKAQNKDGSWGSPTLTKDLNIFASVMINCVASAAIFR